MAAEILPIVHAGAPVLRALARDVPRGVILAPEFQALIARMIATMRAAPGVGLAAPQIGVSARVIVLEDRAELLARVPPEHLAERERVAFGPKVFVNPVLTLIDSTGENLGEHATFFEGCLSVPGYMALVERHREVEVSGLDENGEPQTWRVKGWPARILQHEVDHIDGRLYIDRMNVRSFARTEQAGGDEDRSLADVKRLLGVDD